MQSREDKLRYFLAILLSLGVLFFWTFFSNPPDSKPAQENGKKEAAPAPTAPRDQSEGSVFDEQENSGGNALKEEDIFVPEEKNELPPGTAGVDSSSRETNAAKKRLTEELVSLEGENLKIEFSSKNAVVKKVFLTYSNFRDRITTPNIEYGLPQYATGNIAFSLNDENIGDNYYEIVENNGKRLVFRTKISIENRSLVIYKTYSLDKYKLNLDVRFQDENGEEVRVNYYLFNGSDIGVKKATRNIFDITEISYTQGDNTETVLSKGFFSFFSEDKDKEELSLDPDWISIDNRFYIRLVTSKAPVDKAIFLKKDQNNQEYSITGYKLKSGNENFFTFYFLPKQRSLLDEFYDEEKAYFFNLFHQYKFMRILSNILYFFIQEIYRFVNNYGWSILIITMLLKISILPLTHKSMKSMKRMQELSPKMKAIRNNFKNNPQKLNAEMMNLYRKEKINPLGGCVPMLIPLPIFIAFYSLFRNMVELQGVPFLWITDLSLPDVLFRFDTSLPLIGMDFHLLPFVMTITSFAQSMMTPQTTTPENRQQIIMMKYFLPVFFLFISWSMPSALILFWMAQNLFSIAQMLFIKVYDRKKVSLKNARI